MKSKDYGMDHNTSVKRLKACIFLFCILIIISIIPENALASKRKSLPAETVKCNKVLIIPLDSRNQTYSYTKRIVRIYGYQPVMPPRRMMGNISEYEDAFKKQWNIWLWLNHNLDGNCGILILSVDSLVYGGLLESRTSPIDMQQAMNNVKLVKIIKKKYPSLKILAFTSIPRKEAQRRERNLAVNLELLSFVKEGTIDFLSISGDDVTDIEKQVAEIARLKEFISSNRVGDRVLISDVDRIRLGIDESAMVIFTRYMNRMKKTKPKVYVEYRDITAARVDIDRYSATPIMSLAIDMIDAIGGETVYDKSKADLVLAVNHPSSKFSDENFISRIVDLIGKKPVTIGDLSNRDEKANFFRKLYEAGIFPQLAGYATWGMGTNTLGTSLCMGCSYLSIETGSTLAQFLSFLYERMLADYIYLNNIHLSLARKTGIPAYSLKRMSEQEEETAVNITMDEITANLKELGIRCSEVMLKNKGENRKKSDVRFIPLSPEESSFELQEGRIVEFEVNLGQAGKENFPWQREKEFKVVAGPVSFPFHRLFEVNIPVNVEFIDKLNREN